MKKLDPIRTHRMMITIGDYCRYVLKLSAFVNSRPVATEAVTVLCEHLKNEEDAIKTRLKFIAEQRGIELDDLINQIVSDDDD